MATEHRIFKQDGYLNIGSGIGTESRNITYHPNLNVILAFDSQNQVKILDVHSGVILQNYDLNTNESEQNVCGKYLPLQEKVIFWDGRNLGFRGDYNNVLLLDTILQPPILQNDDLIKLELLLSEAVIFQTSLKELEQEGLECPHDVSNELLDKIKNAQANAKKGIKAQRWNTICLEISYSSLKLVANNVVVTLKRLERHIPALAIASAINERLTDLLAGSRILDISWHGGNFQRVLMYSEAVRRQTFEKWPHMDYKWALPDQMAQAGFYHQPSSSGEDRAMCFTCNVCLVCWEKTDEPWSEHERHSPTCPFVKGEYTQNVPLSVSYATNPAVAAPAPGYDVISNSDYANVLCTSSSASGEITIWSIERHLKKMHTFNVACLMKDVCDDSYESVRVTAICVLPNARAQSKIMGGAQLTPGGNNASGNGATTAATSTSTLRAGVVDSKIVLGLSIRQSAVEAPEMRLVVLNIVESERALETISGNQQASQADSGNTNNSSSSNNSNMVTGAGDANTENQCEKYDQRDDDNKSSSSFFEKYADSFDSNGFMPDLVAIKSNGTGSSSVGAGDKSDAATAALNELFLESELIKIDTVCDLSVGSYFKEKLYAAANNAMQQQQQKQLQQQQNNGNIDGSGGNSTTISKPVSEEIDCVVESCTSVRRMNAMTQRGGCRDGEVTEIAEIVPTNGSCNQLLVRLMKTQQNDSQIIMATTEVEEELDDDAMDGNADVNSDSVAAQILLYDNTGFVVAHDYTAAISFSRAKSPRQLCLLPSYSQIERRAHDRSSLDAGALCVVCADGSLELYALDELRSITTVSVEHERFVSVVYCKSLDRVCGCTSNGSLIFYSLNDTDNESGDEMFDLDEECNTTLVQVAASAITAKTAPDAANELQPMLDVCETDGAASNTALLRDASLTPTPMPNIRVDLGAAGAAQSSPSPSSSSSLSAANLLAYKTTELTLEDLQTFYALTQFDELLTPYTAEVPSCWNELVQAQKQRKQPQHLRPGDDTHLTKTWRLHNDATTWDEHIIELNLAKSVTLGHIDMKFTLYQQCSNPAAIQVTLLKQNTSGFGYRMKGPHAVNMAFKQTSVDENIDFSLNNSDGSNENPVITEEYLQTHNAEILAGPIELSSCMDLCDQGGTITLTSPKLFKTRTRNFLLHIKTMSDPSKEGQGKTRVPVRKRGVMRLLISSFANSSSHNFINNNTSSSTSSFPPNSTSKQSRNDFYIGCDWLHEISITVRGVKPHNRIPNERLQRIAMLESNVLLDNLLRIVSSATSTTLAKNLALDILNWICTIRLNRFRSPKTERLKPQQTQAPKMQSDKNSGTSTAAATSTTTTTNPAGTDLVAQQAECIAITEKYLQDTILQCIVRSDRSMAHKCVKLILILTDGVCNLPSDIQAKSTLDMTIKNAVASTLSELPKARCSSVVRWFNMLACSTSTPASHNSISEICIKLLTEVAQEIDNRWDPHCSLLGTRFGLYGFPFEPEIFDFDLPNLNKGNLASTKASLAYIIRSHAGLLQTASVDFKKLSSIDGVEFRTFPHLIKCKGVSNQLRGLLEVEQLHFTCAATSEATRIDNMDSASSSSASNINMEELIVPPIQPVTEKDKEEEKILDKMNDIVNNVKNILVDKQMKIGNSSKQLDNESNELTPNGFGPAFDTSSLLLPSNEEMQFKYNSGINNHNSNKTLPKFKYICKFIENCDENGSNGSNNTTDGNQSDAESKLSSKVQRYLNEQQQQQQHEDTANMNAKCGNVFAWHKILAPPPKQMVVIDRMHSGARRYVVLDFGSPILLTDLVIPACDELASLHIDIWCFEEEADSVRLVVAQDIGTKTLVLSDIQPPPICRYMKITIIGRYGMSSTKCKIPIGSFYGHTVVLESDGYGDALQRYMKLPLSNMQAQLSALNSLYEDVHCRYSLASCKLLEMLSPIINCDLSNVAHMQAFINKQREEENNMLDNSKIVTTYEECIMLQHQINVLRNVIYRLETSLPAKPTASSSANGTSVNLLQLASRDKLRVLSQNLVEILLHFSIEYGIKNILPLHTHFNIDVANMLFNTLVVYGDAHIQLATCSLLVRMCCFQSWWGDFLADIFCNLFSSQNSKIFPQDRTFFLLTYLGRRSIAMGTCRSIVIDAVLKTLAKLLAPISPRYQAANEHLANMCHNETSGLWSKSDLQLITWLLLFLSVCLDDNAERKDKSSNRWEFMSCETDFTKTRSQSNSSSGKQLRCFKKRIIQQNKYSVQPYTDWGKKIYMIQNEHPGIFMELTGKPKASKSGKTNAHPKLAKETTQEPENNFDKGLKAIRFNNILIVIRGLIALLLEMDFTCNMDLFLLTCKVIARLVSACRPSVQLSKIMTNAQLEQLIRLAVWNDQQQPWAVHAITCLLQDLLDADKHFKDNDSVPAADSLRPMEGVQETKDIFADYASLYLPQNLGNMSGTSSDMQYNDGVKYSYLPSLIECEDTEFDDILNDIDIMDRSRNLTKKDSLAQNKNNFNFFCKSISSAMDARLDCGIDTNVEIHMRRLTMIASLDMYASLPQILTNEFITTPAEATHWPEYITDIWSGPEYNCGRNTYQMFKSVFDCIFADLHLQDTWVHLEQVLQMWMTLNSELSEKPYNNGLSQSDIPKIPFGANAVQGLLLALAWHNDIKLRTWCLGFQCLYLSCNSQSNEAAAADTDLDSAEVSKINDIIINDENFEKMLLRFFSGYGMSSTIITNRCAGPTICKHLHELLLWLHKKGEIKTDSETTPKKRKLKDTLLNVILQLVQPGGAISNQQGPIDAQSQLVRDLLFIPYDKADLNVSLSIIESVSFLVYNNISNGDKIQCQRSSDVNNSNNTFSSLFANVLGSENSKQNTSISDNSLIISLLKLSASLIQTELPRQPNVDGAEVPEEDIMAESQTDETKAEQLSGEGNKTKTSYIADTVLRHFPTMKRLLGSLSHCTSISFTLMASYTLYTVKPTDSSFLLDEPQTTADAVFYLLISLCEKATHQRLIVAPICQYLETSTLQRNSLPRLQLSEPFLYYIFKVLEVPSAVQIFTQLGGIQIICQNLVKLNKILINMQPGLISLIMQHMTKNTKLKLHSHAANGNSKKSSTSSAQPQRNANDGLINFAPFCSISSENDTAQSADILIVNPVASHRRPRTPAWSYMFYPNESHVDLTITLPTAILLKEIQLQPHSPTLASCPSAVALEVSRDYGLGPIPFGPPLTTTGMTCIRLKLAKPEIATSVVLRLYRPKDSSNIGLTQIAILGNTIFSANGNMLGVGAGGSSSGSNNLSYDQCNDDDAFAKTSIGWMRILARCYNMADVMSDAQLTADVIGASASYSGFLEACCSLMNIMPMIPQAALQNLETVLLKLGAHSRDLCLALMRTLLWSTTPQTYKLSNESICDLLFDLATAKQEYISDKIRLLLEWIVKLRHHFSNRNARCTNPQSGFVKCVASILWSVHARQQHEQLHELITNEIFDACMYWIDALEQEEPLKLAFDSLLCALCCIKPELFNQLLCRLNVTLMQSKLCTEAGSSTSAAAALAAVNNAAAAAAPPPTVGITDDNKCCSGSAWFQQVAASNLTTVLRRPVYLSTLAMACQSPLAVYQLVDSGLLKLLAYALYEYCCSLSPEIERVSAPSELSNANSNAAHNGANMSNSSLTDADKAQNYERLSDSSHAAQPPLLSVHHVPKILDFFSECCAEGHVRDWLGTQHGSIFWRPLLELLCNYRPMLLSDDQMQQAFIRMERATINFLSRVTACHPKNQDNLTLLLISVIKSPSGSGCNSGSSSSSAAATSTAAAAASANKSIISGFTRQIVLQLLLENERILVSVRSKQPLQKRDAATTLAGSGSTMALVNHHPSKRINAHHLLFYVSANTKCQEILQNCVSDTRQHDGTSAAASSASNISSSNNSEIKHDNNEKSTAASVSGTDSNMFMNFNGLEHGMEFLSVAAGVTAKDKRIKDVKNHAAANKDSKDIFPNFPKFFSIEDFLTPSNASSISSCAQLVHPDCPDVLLTSDTTISQVLATLHSKGQSLSTPCITLNLTPVKSHNDDHFDESVVKAVNMEPLPSPLQRFSSRGGLSLLAQYLPTVYPEGAGRKSPNITLPEKEKSPPMTDWVKLEPNDEIYEDLEDPITEPTAKHAAITAVPQHSLAAFGLFLRLPAYSDVLLRDKLRAQCLLRLVLGVTGDGEGNDIYSLSLAPTLPTLPFEVFRQLLDSAPLTTDDGLLLRRLVIKEAAMHLVLNCLSIFTHQSHNYQIVSPQTELATGSGTAAGIKPAGTNVDDASLAASDDKSPMYWAKGTGFGTGSTAQSWNVEQALLRQKSEEEHVTVLLQVLSSYINPGDKIPASMLSDEILIYHEISDVFGELPTQFLCLLQQSCLIPALSSYLRNDSVLDITRHIPLYRAILQLLRALSMSQQLVGLLQPQNGNSSSPSISELLANMKTCVDTYAKRLKVNKKSNIKGQTQQVTVNIDDGDDEGLALLIPDIQETAVLVQKATKADSLANQSRCNADGLNCLNIDRPPQIKSIEQRYLEVMKKLQFDTSEMIVESENNGFRFVISHHFEKMVRMAGDRYHPSRVKRLAQEAVTLSTSLPLSYSSSVFVRCDTDRLDIMKVLITGPADTPYANGCFEFDVFFPPDYPNLPMLINLETTGRHSVRFNPNLYNDGKVCLSVLNTWHGRPEEKWNAQTSSFLQVLVSIQSLILVPEPYFNEPGFERSRWSISGMHSSREYNSNIYQACVRWAMLEQIRNPSPCFKDVIHTHFWLKRNEICAQIENWIEELSKPQFSERNSRTISFNSMVLRRQYRHLREELGKLKTPEGLEDLDMPFNPNVTLPVVTDATTSAINTPTTTTTASSGTCSNIDGSITTSSTPSTNAATTTANIFSGAAQAVTQLSEKANSIDMESSLEATDMDKASVMAVDVAAHNLASPAPSTPVSTSSCSENTPIPMLIEVNNSDFNDLSGCTTYLPPQPPVPTPATATITTVAHSNSNIQQVHGGGGDDDDEELEDVDVSKAMKEFNSIADHDDVEDVPNNMDQFNSIGDEVLMADVIVDDDDEEEEENDEDVSKVMTIEYNSIDDEVIMLQSLIYNDETYENSKLNDFID